MDPGVAPHHDDRVLLLHLLQLVLLALLTLPVIGRWVAPALDSEETNLLIMPIDELAILALCFELEQFILDGHVLPAVDLVVSDDIIQRHIIWKAIEPARLLIYILHGIALAARRRAFQVGILTLSLCHGYPSQE